MSDSCEDNDEVKGWIKLEYLRNRTDTVGIINELHEYEIVSTKHIRRGSVVYIVQKDESVRKALVI